MKVYRLTSLDPKQFVSSLMAKVTLLKKTGIASILMFIVFELCQYPSRAVQRKGLMLIKTKCC